MTLFNLRAGDNATIRTPQGQDRSGRVLCASSGHVVLAVRDGVGALAVGTAANIVRVRLSVASRVLAQYRAARLAGMRVPLACLAAAIKLLASAG